ncbi:MAG: chitobiase/beta-hexosaminidase C-terminal domain-containing protein [Bacteroidales bacterium]|nr:chitobiase/beta-hexosaminidase C-terminal domain-containing protein [Bacteroidales bacterium]
MKGIDAISLQSNWFETSFDDSGWNTGIAPFRYGDGSGGTELTDMQGSYSTVFLRSEFTVQNKDDLGQVKIGLDWDDGFILWINGKQVISQQAPSSVSYDALASGSHESGTPETFTYNVSELELVEGVNSIAVLACNISLDGSSDFYYDMNIFAQAELPDLPEFIDTLGVTFSHPSGFYNENFSLSLSSPVEGASIVYTLDGSNPGNSGSSFLYDPLNGISIDPTSTNGRTLTPAVVVRASVVKEGYNPSSRPSAGTFIFLEHVKTQGYPGGNWPPPNLSDRTQYYVYNMDSQVVNSPEYSNQIDAALLDIPSISLITNNSNLFDDGYGIYARADQHGYEWERECSVELFYPDGSEGFNINAGLRIRGGWSRHYNYPKHAFRLFFREEYGYAKLNYPLFEDEGVSEFDKIDLRCAQNYSWANGASKYNTFVREVFARDAQKDSGQPYSRSRYYHLYINGLYWGLYQTQERAEARFASGYFGGQSEDYDVIKPNGVDYLRNVIATDGTIDKWKEIFDLTQKGYESNEDYFKMEGKDSLGNAMPGGEVYVEIDNLIDYMMNIIFTGNYDSPTGGWSNNKQANNFFASGNREKKNEGFRFFIHDAEHSLMNEASSGPGIGLYENRADIGDRSGSYQMKVYSIDNFHPQWLHYKLSKNEEYRVRFADHAWKQLTGDGIFTQEQNTQRFNKRAGQIDMAIIAESARWGGSRTSTAKTKADWLNELDVVRNKYFPYRTNIVIDQLEDLDLFPSIMAAIVEDAEDVILDSEVFISASKDITITNPQGAGSLYYTIDGSDPRIVGGEVNENAIMISSGKTIRISSSMVLKTRVLINNEWSALREIIFIADQKDYSHFKVTELHYHPRIEIVGVDTTFNEMFEFIEFKNTSHTEGLNLGGLVLDSSVYYEFPENYILPPDQYFVVASKPTYFFERYGMHPSGNYQRNFSNAGERVIVRKLPGDDIIDFTYDDAAPWPEYADGIGASMTSVEFSPEGDPNDYDYWTSSTALHGTPFGSDSIPEIIESIESRPLSSVQLYPNPTHNLLMVQNSLEVEYQSTLRIYDITGAIYFVQDFENYLEISLNSLNMRSGIYLLEITCPMGREIRKVVYSPR